MAEAALLAAVAPAARSLAPQVTALPPLAVYHDLRWLYAFGGGWPVFTMLVIAFLVFRSGWNAVLVRLAWPADRQAPPMRSLLNSSFTLTAFSALLLSPIATLMFGVSVIPFSWPFLASLAAMLLIALPLSHGGVTGWWWQTLPPLTAAGWLLTDFVALSAAAALIGRLPAAASIPVAGAAGLVNAYAWHAVTKAATRPAQRPARLPRAPIAAAAIVALVVGATWLVFVAAVRGSPHQTAGTRLAGDRGVSSSHLVSGGQAAGPAQASPPGRPASLASAGKARPARPRPVLQIAGFGSSCCTHGGSLRRTLPGRLVEQFSYRGLSKSGHPLPHGPQASNLPLTVLGSRIAAQVWRLHKETGQRVDVVAESEGTLGVDAMLAQHPGVPIGSVALLSPILTPGQGGYLAIGGPGQELPAGDESVAGAELRAVVWLVGGLSPFGTSGAETFITSVGSHGASFAAAARPRLAGSLQFLPLADAVTLPACGLPQNVKVVPALHGELLGDPAVLSMVRDFFDHRSVPARPGLRTTAEVVAAVATAWRIPQAGYPSPPCQP
jgi:hypothetical protein